MRTLEWLVLTGSRMSGKMVVLLGIKELAHIYNYIKHCTSYLGGVGILYLVSLRHLL